MLWFTVKWRPKFIFSFQRLKGLFSYGWKLLVSALLDVNTDIDKPFEDIDFFEWPVIVKPVDSAGSKGVTKVDKPEDLKEAIKTALGESHNSTFIIEDFLTFKGYHSSADVFTVDGEIKFITYSDQLFDPEADNPYTPAYIIWPSTMEDVHQQELTREIGRLVKLLGMTTGIYNIETCVGSNGKPYIMEVSPCEADAR